MNVNLTHIIQYPDILMSMLGIHSTRSSNSDIQHTIFISLEPSVYNQASLDLFR